MPVRVVEYGGRELEGHLTEVGVSGAKARLGVALEPSTVARLVFTPPDGGPPIEAVAILVRVDADGHAFTFVRLTAPDAERLRALVGSTAGGGEAGPSGSGA
jgi:hypothetical protein